MHVQRQAGRTANGLDHRKTETDVGHEMPIHDVQVQDLGPGLFQAANFLLQMGKIGSQQRRPDHGGRRMNLGDDILSRHRIDFLNA